MIDFQTFISLKTLVMLLIIDGKGRRPVERQGSESPRFLSNFCLNHNIYKQNNINTLRIFPSDLTGSLDALFHISSPRYLLRNIPGFIINFSFSGGLL